MELDYKLIYECGLLAGSEFVHLAANLTGAYRSAVEIYRESRDEDFKEVAVDAERSLRVLVIKIRPKRADEMGFSRQRGGA